MHMLLLICNLEIESLLLSCAFFKHLISSFYAWCTAEVRVILFWLANLMLVRTFQSETSLLWNLVVTTKVGVTTDMQSPSTKCPSLCSLGRCHATSLPVTEHSLKHITDFQTQQIGSFKFEWVKGALSVESCHTYPFRCSDAEALTQNVTIFGDGSFERLLEEMMRAFMVGLVSLSFWHLDLGLPKNCKGISFCLSYAFYGICYGSPR